MSKGKGGKSQKKTTSRGKKIKRRRHHGPPRIETTLEELCEQLGLPRSNI